MHTKVHDNKMKKIETKELFFAKIKNAQRNDGKRNGQQRNGNVKDEQASERTKSSEMDDDGSAECET